MAIETVSADPELVRRTGIGIRQCAACGEPYNIDEAFKVEKCRNAECPTNMPDNSEVWEQS